MRKIFVTYNTKQLSLIYEETLKIVKNREMGKR